MSDSQLLKLAPQPEPPLATPWANPPYDLVAVAASLGGLRALSQLLSVLPADFAAAIVVVQHLSPHHRSWLADILQRCTVLPVKQAEEADRLRRGAVYIAPPNKHLLVNADGRLCLCDSPPINFCRPAADKLFESVATSLKERAIAVVLTGKDGDGALGVRAIKQRGGTVIVQDEATCVCFSMPSAAIATGSVDFVLPLDQIGSTLTSLVGVAKAAPALSTAAAGAL